MSKFQKVRYVTIRTDVNPEEKQIQLDNANYICKLILEGFEITSTFSDGSSVHYVLCLKSNIWQRIKMAIYGYHTVKMD